MGGMVFRGCAMAVVGTVSRSVIHLVEEPEVVKPSTPDKTSTVHNYYKTLEGCLGQFLYYFHPTFFENLVVDRILSAWVYILKYFMNKQTQMFLSGLGIHKFLTWRLVQPFSWSHIWYTNNYGETLVLKVSIFCDSVLSCIIITATSFICNCQLTIFFCQIYCVSSHTALFASEWDSERT